MAGLDAALADAASPAGPAAPYGWRHRQPSRRTRDVSRSSLYRIHGSNEPDTIGQATSSGCIRLTNEDVIDLYSRVRIGTPVIVQ
jgi:lipoprotein-anchoring transpeptidase ErfK/SrfK